jgi:hypothetical protein
MKMFSLKGKDKYETAEKYSIATTLLGAVLLAAGIGLSTLSTTGIPTIMAMIGSLIAFLGTIALIVSWLWAEFAGAE